LSAFRRVRGGHRDHTPVDPDKIFIQEESAETSAVWKRTANGIYSFVEELARAKGVKIERELRRGAIYTEILAVTDEKKADLIVLGGWEKERSSRDIISHAHREIMVSARCSVFVVKEPNIDMLYKQA
jgi:nucleotide-binding universal stress UspA family protein